ncbi:hypothetical protein C8F04DRAFT_1072305 [Mycena alexandri]|uniref:Uncharacterized protein n=1 Tax=Mycena alexandri TaxID=1745969 RepID=A0AAD6X8Y5_9AGAR|nr:hypothetical protein C8F04DRAFT_1072305 [Mycena alexandri]
MPARVRCLELVTLLSLYMNFELPPPGQEAVLHPPALTWTELNRLPNIRPFLGWTTYPFVTYDDWMRKYTSEYCPVYNRQPGRPEFELHGVINDGAHQGGYVSVDAHTLIMTPTRLRPGQYHHNADEREWKYYADPAKAPSPRRSYGFYRSVVDFGQEARGQLWDLFLAMREPIARDDTRPGILIIARKDYAFAIPPGYRPRDVEWTAGCEPSSLVKVGDYRIPENGCLEFRDKIAHGIPELAGHFEVLSGAGDGIYPVEIIKNPQGIVTCVSDEVNAGRKRRRKSTGDMLDITKGFLKDLGSAARRGVQ